MRRWMLAEPVVVTILQYVVNQTILLHALNLDSDMGQLFPNKTRKKWSF